MPTSPAVIKQAPHLHHITGWITKRKDPSRELNSGDEKKVKPEARSSYLNFAFCLFTFTQLLVNYPVATLQVKNSSSPHNPVSSPSMCSSLQTLPASTASTAVVGGCLMNQTGHSLKCAENTTTQILEVTVVIWQWPDHLHAQCCIIWSAGLSKELFTLIILAEQQDSSRLFFFFWKVIYITSVGVP